MTTKRDLLKILTGINAFDELIAALSKISDNKVKGDLFEYFCQAYLREIYPEQFKTVERLEEIKDTTLLTRLGLRISKDYGIDLIAVTKNDKIWTIQAKFRSGNTLNWRELSTFFSSSEKADFKLVMGNLDKIYHPLAKIENFSSIINLSFRNLTEYDFDRIRHSLDSTVVVRKYSPLPHQIRAIGRALEYYKTNDKGQMIHASGTGKTLTALWIKEAMGSKNAVVFLPSLSLLKQTLEEWSKHKSHSFSTLCICSDPTVAKGANESDEPVIDITELGVPVTTDSEIIRKFLTSSDGNKVVFCTYQSTDVLLKVTQSLKDFFFDFGVFDEAHRTTSAEGLFGLCHVVPIRKKLFMTATPRIYEPRLKRKAEEEDTLLFSMDDPATYGLIFDEITFGEAINRHLLADYKIKLIIVSNDDIKNLIDQRYWLKVSGKHVTADNLAKLWALIQVMAEVKHVVSFHSRINRAKEFSQNLGYTLELLKSTTGQKIDITAFHVSGKYPASERSSILHQFIEAPKSIVTNARCLTEGIDVPNIDGVYFVDPKKDPVDIVQSIGRAIRKKSDPTIEYGSIILPVFIDSSKDIQDIVEDTAFEPVWRVLQAMKDQDNRLEHTVDQLRILEGIQRFNKTKDRDSQEFSELQNEISSKLSVISSTITKKINMNKFLKSISLKTVDVIGRDWDYNFGVLKGFIETNKREPSTSSDDAEEQRIARWAAGQRQAFSRGIMSQYPGRIELFKELGYELDIKKARVIKAWTYPNDKIPKKFWMQTGPMTGGSRNILDLSMSGPNGSKGGVGLFGIDSNDIKKETNLTFVYKGVRYENNTIKYPSTETKKPNDSWRLQIKGVSKNGEKLAPICKINFTNKILIFERNSDGSFTIQDVDENRLEEFKQISLSWDKNGASKKGRAFGILA